MASASTATMVHNVIALSLLLVLHLSSRCEANRGIAMGATWRGSQSSVRSLGEMPDDPGEDEEEEVCEADVASFIFAGADLHRSPKAMPSEAHAVTSSAAGVLPGPYAGPKAEARDEAAVPLLPDGEAQPLWEANFVTGVFESKRILEIEDLDSGSWVSDSDSGAAVPAQMLQAEVLLRACDQAPAESLKEKRAERALRIYYHAKWLAERNYARAAEHRYRESARLARLSRRSVLASHALARLGYFLVHWRRVDEAAGVLQESMKLNTKSNPLAPYLYGVLERKAFAGDIERLRTAEDAILKSGEQPSEELEVERFKLIEEISYWRESEGSSRQCFASSDAAYVLICLCGHAAALLKGFLGE